MISLFSGTPGAGKTCYIVAYLLKLQDKDNLPPLYQHGIKGLKIPHVYLFCESPQCRTCTELRELTPVEDRLYAKDWDTDVPSGSLIVLDEVQLIFRARGSSTKPPPGVVAMETHRHQGIDMLLASQSPKLIDSNVREFVSRHVHLKSTILWRKSYEWPECNLDVKRTNNAVVGKYSLPKRAFDQYVSAELHTKQARKIPWQIYLIIPGVIYFIYLISKIYTDTFADDPVVTSSLGSSTQQLASSNTTNTDYLPTKFDFEPTISLVLESAPAYQSLVQVQDFPRIAACMSKPKRCTCYTQQNTVYPTTYETCMDFIGKRTFDPYKPKPVPERRSNDDSYADKSLLTNKE